jgi:FtsZ-binding cell division protein ZapB
MMKKIAALVMIALCASAAKQPEQWLDPARKAELNRILYRPVVIKQEQTADGMLVLTWTNGLHGCVTTQKLEKVLGKASKDVRKETIEALKAERDAAKAERDVAKAERDAVKAERDTLKTENEKLKKEKSK